MGRGRKPKKICRNWLLYWGYTRGYTFKQMAEMLRVHTITIRRRYKEFGLPALRYSRHNRSGYKKVSAVMKYKAGVTKYPPWELNTNISYFLHLLDTYGDSSVDVGKCMREFRKAFI